MTKEYEPEVGQAIFGNTFQNMTATDSVTQALATIGMYLLSKKQINPTENTAHRYENDTFEMFAYDWNEDNDQQYNFRWKDFEVSWYKYLGRGMSMNREISEKEITQMINECIKSITKGNNNETGNFIRKQTNQNVAG